MDSKLVVEQMAGNWKIKHPSMKPLAHRGQRLAPIGTTFTWVPRAENAHADRLANEALDGLRDASGHVGGRGTSVSERPETTAEEPQAWLGPTAEQADHPGPRAPRRHRRDQGQALLRRPGQLATRR